MFAHEGKNVFSFIVHERKTLKNVLPVNAFKLLKGDLL